MILNMRLTKMNKSLKEIKYDLAIAMSDPNITE